ncbi:MAG TPA: amidohydrolase family protein, partial [Candidatus Baltobacteraceae bacterium]|nr:amidohydrolase family protein [Candidatus Baltobacteraceae bacterium]
MNPSFVLGPARLAIGDGTTRYGRIQIEHERIFEILDGDGPSDLPLPGDVIVTPGLIDVHTNGSGEHLFNRDQGNAVEIAARAYATYGATAFVAAVMTAPWESMLHAASEVAEAAHELAERSEPIGARCLGLHIEGPFLNPKYRRIHRSDCLLTATMERGQELFEACRGALLMVTMAPEIEGVSELARFYHDHGVVCSAGHTAARYRDGVLAIGYGFRSLTHAFNGMSALDHRDPSILAAFVQEPRTMVQAICDGYHVAPVMIDILYRMLGDRLVLVTDYTPPTGSGYRIEGGVVRSEDGTIAGSALRPDHGLRNLMQYAQLPFERAIISATQAPARLLNLTDDLGTISPGKRADLTVWNTQHDVLATFVGGH